MAQRRREDCKSPRTVESGRQQLTVFRRHFRAELGCEIIRERPYLEGRAAAGRVDGVHLDGFELMVECMVF